MAIEGATGGFIAKQRDAYYRAKFSTLRKYVRFKNSYLGGSILSGTAEAFGWQYGNQAGPGIKSYGFLGLKNTMKEIMSNPSNFKPDAKKMSFLSLKPKAMFGAGINTLGGSIGLAFTLASAYQGYQEGGVEGAAKNVITESIPMMIVPRIGLGVLKGALPATGVLAATAAIGYTGYAVGNAAMKWRKATDSLELGGRQVLDALGSAGVATMRQRSIAALQNTHLNARGALGNEALILHTRYF